ncbi:MAG: RNA pseudouridine synthase [Candidatus Schekmanbacteria bacterium RIFCSPHIGHO2_02_FULL_38_11]|uniref:Pseudouridine synthase n=1 Tax=Candidatus Schekmanbacteria bacterium RIFCSPLOWO2_12_FULL_38_15 TaxID=1817883 RepID=A0A1F7SNR3_9BACT|nr:MAG: RNA pseudouridine synthase [Candidatus Schekmanbacteria bacterium GWA2_38_9]OGL50278.1 MAG: RNA pseudouridine synthase [Candidatus Schekmanbacteria bacterium RIFCSPLOWO2_02_FULL_38_14]OGL55411.1 MAG: RNA pseudouridine synthase [Candidatus Schekmanbacteria bacterium RIFCSPLOWO2_12_FULL_38_15]OGL55674.1 MAG: RNA pseudouridine synthase [Candidatus Schekmanbacteria bacterium RIFCSPHIGHO2_02_FULL_38_11]
MKKFSFSILKTDSGKRLDVFLHEKMSGYSRSFIQKLIKDGAVLVNFKPAKMSHRISASESITVSVPEPKSATPKPEDIPLKIVYEDSSMLVIDKPAGMVVHPAAGNYSGTLVNAILYHCKDLSGIGGEMRPGIVHRLDKETSGLMVVAKSDKAHISLSKQLQKRTLTREYIAIVRKLLPMESGEISKPLGRSERDRKKISVQTKRGREAVTQFQVLERFKNHTFVKVKLKTGRTHQIRVHFQSLGFPVLGDKVYGGVLTQEEKNIGIEISRQALHSQYIKFIHPETGKVMEFKSNLPEDIEEVLRILRGL